MCRTPFFPGTEYNSESSKDKQDHVDALQAFRYDISNVDEVFAPKLPDLSALEPIIALEDNKVSAPRRHCVHSRCRCKRDACRDGSDSETSVDSDATLPDSESDDDTASAASAESIKDKVAVDLPEIEMNLPSITLPVELPEMPLPGSATPSLGTDFSLLSTESKPVPSAHEVPQVTLPSPSFHPGKSSAPKRHHAAISQQTVLPAPWAKAPTLQEPLVEPAKRQHASEERAPKRCKHACTNCYKSKTRCSGQRPCQRCVRLGKEDSCVDRQHKKLGRPRKVRNQPRSRLHPGVPDALVLQQMLVQNPGLVTVLQQLQQQQQKQQQQQQQQQQWMWQQPASAPTSNSVALPAHQAAAALARVPNNAMVHVSVTLPQQQPTNQLPSLTSFTNTGS